MSDAARPLRPEVLQEIVAGTASHTGERFFDELVRHLGRAMGTKCAWLTEWLPDTRALRALSFWTTDGYLEDVEYDVAGTPCEPVVDRLERIHFPERVIELFPGDASLLGLASVSYLGVPLLDTDGALLGHLALLDDKVMEEDLQALAVFDIFAGRAAAEMRRIRRDAALAASRERLARVFHSTMDGIVELDQALAITQLNPAAAASLGLSEDAVGTPFERCVDGPSHGKLHYLALELHRGSGSRESLWIPEGLRMRRGDESTFQAEATLARSETGGRAYFSLVFRNIDDRLEAEARIRSLLAETEFLKAELDSVSGFGDILGRSEALRRVLSDVDRVAQTDSTVLVTGETGTGKELIAREIHRRGSRADGPLIRVNCAAIPTNLQESEFFGHEKGAFTGATQRREGRFKLADRGTLFLDEVGELPLDLQAKLLRVLQEGEYEPVGGAKTVRVDVRLVAATNRDLHAMVDEGTFRRDLLYRLNVFPIEVPPLRERGDDIVVLAEAFLEDAGRRVGRPGLRLSDADRARLRRYPWPGNVRELQNVVERAVIVSEDGARPNLDRALPESPTGTEPVERPTRTAGEGRVLTDVEMRDLERSNLVRALEEAGWKVSGPQGAAERLGLKPNTLASRMKVLGIRRPTTGS